MQPASCKALQSFRIVATWLLAILVQAKSPWKHFSCAAACLWSASMFSISVSPMPKSRRTSFQCDTICLHIQIQSCRVTGSFKRLLKFSGISKPEVLGNIEQITLETHNITFITTWLTVQLLFGLRVGIQSGLSKIWFACTVFYQLPRILSSERNIILDIIASFVKYAEYVIKYTGKPGVN